MKKSLLKLVFLLLAVPIIFIGCKKTDVVDESNTTTNITKVVPVYCGTPVVKNLYEYGANTNVYGTVTVGNDATNLYVTINLANDWVFWNEGFQSWEMGLHVFVGTQAQLLALDGDHIVNPDGTGYFGMYLFPYNADGTEVGTNSFMFTVPRSQILDDQGAILDCPVLVVGASIKDGNGNLKLVSAAQNTKHWAYWFTYCMQTCITHHETGYAFGGALATCLTQLNGVASNNWGWTNYITGPIETIHWPVYIGAGQCDISKGTLVGYLDGSYMGGVLNLHYTMNPPYEIEVSHLWVGTTPLPIKKGKYTTAPGQFGNSVPCNISIAPNFYVAAHAVVTW